MSVVTQRSMAWLGIALVVMGLAVLAPALEALTRVAWHGAQQRHRAWIEPHLRRSRVGLSAQSVGLVHLTAVVSALLSGVLVSRALGLVLVVLVVLGPWWLLQAARTRRTERIEAQLDVWLLTLANALKAAPALGEALASTCALTGGPLCEELALALVEHRLGSPLDRALVQMAERIGSPVVRVAVATLQIARTTGGALASTLEQSAASLRELARLEGVVRTKTAEARMQAWVVAAVPVLMVGVLDWTTPELLASLWTSWRGHAVLLVAVVLWLLAVYSALLILKVDV